jgi:Flp pilus assembly protein TadB
MTAGRVAAVLLLVTAVLFSVGVAIERRDSGHEAAAAVTPDREGAEAHESGESAESVESAESADQDHGENEAVLGVDLESPWTVAAAVAVSAALAVGLWVSSRRWLAVIAAAFAVLFAALDIDELVHQVTEHRAWLVAIAVLLAVGHLAAGALAGTSSRAGP